MKVPKARKLPSGSWYTQVQVNKRRVSVTADTEKECLAKAMAIKAEMEEAEIAPTKLSLGDAIDRYIESKDSVLSPSTVLGYQRIRKNYFPELMNVQVSKLTQEMIQRAVNKMAKTASPKTIRNAHGLVSAVLVECRPNMTLHTTLPQKEKKEIQIPDEQQITTILTACKGDRLELPILLALWMGLRASEIRGLTWDSIKGEYIHIKQAVVRGPEGLTIKKTKTLSSNRQIKAPKQIIELIKAQPKTDEYIIHMSAQAIYEAFSRFCEKNGLPHFRFHDLRHASASVSLMLGVPDKYSMRRMGHSTNSMLQSVYQHTLQSQEDIYAAKIDDYFSKKRE